MEYFNLSRNNTFVLNSPSTNRDYANNSNSNNNSRGASVMTGASAPSAPPLTSATSAPYALHDRSGFRLSGGGIGGGTPVRRASVASSQATDAVGGYHRTSSTASSTVFRVPPPPPPSVSAGGGTTGTDAAVERALNNAAGPTYIDTNAVHTHAASIGAASNRTVDTMGMLTIKGGGGPHTPSFGPFVPIVRTATISSGNHDAVYRSSNTSDQHAALMTAMRGGSVASTASSSTAATPSRSASRAARPLPAVTSTSPSSREGGDGAANPFAQYLRGGKEEGRAHSPNDHCEVDEKGLMPAQRSATNTDDVSHHSHSEVVKAPHRTRSNAFSGGARAAGHIAPSPIQHGHSEDKEEVEEEASATTPARGALASSLSVAGTPTTPIAVGSGRMGPGVGMTRPRSHGGTTPMPTYKPPLGVSAAMLYTPEEEEAVHSIVSMHSSRADGASPDGGHGGKSAAAVGSAEPTGQEAAADGTMPLVVTVTADDTSRRPSLAVVANGGDDVMGSSVRENDAAKEVSRTADAVVGGAPHDNHRTPPSREGHANGHSYDANDGHGGGGEEEDYDCNDDDIIGSSPIPYTAAMEGTNGDANQGHSRTAATPRSLQDRSYHSHYGPPTTNRPRRGPSPCDSVVVDRGAIQREWESMAQLSADYYAARGGPSRVSREWGRASEEATYLLHQAHSPRREGSATRHTAAFTPTAGRVGMGMGVGIHGNGDIAPHSHSYALKALPSPSSAVTPPQPFRYYASPSSPQSSQHHTPYGANPSTSANLNGPPSSLSLSRGVARSTATAGRFIPIDGATAEALNASPFSTSRSVAAVGGHASSFDVARNASTAHRSATGTTGASACRNEGLSTRAELEALRRRRLGAAAAADNVNANDGSYVHDADLHPTSPSAARVARERVMLKGAAGGRGRGQPTSGAAGHEGAATTPTRAVMGRGARDSEYRYADPLGLLSATPSAGQAPTAFSPIHRPPAGDTSLHSADRGAGGGGRGAAGSGARRTIVDDNQSGRTAAAITVQRHVRGWLCRMHMWLWVDQCTVAAADRHADDALVAARRALVEEAVYATDARLAAAEAKGLKALAKAEASVQHKEAVEGHRAALLALHRARQEAPARAEALYTARARMINASADGARRVLTNRKVEALWDGRADDAREAKERRWLQAHAVETVKGRWAREGWSPRDIADGALIETAVAEMTSPRGNGPYGQQRQLKGSPAADGGCYHGTSSSSPPSHHY